MATKPSTASIRREYNMDSSDDEAVPVIVFNESSYGIRKKRDANGEVVIKGKPVKAAPIDLDTSNVVPVSKRHVMDAEEYNKKSTLFKFIVLVLLILKYQSSGTV